MISAKHFDHWSINESIILLIVLLPASIYAQVHPADKFNTTESPLTCKIVHSECGTKTLCPETLNIVTTCHARYTDVEIIKKCRNFTDADFIEDYALFAPIICTKKNITYWNIYCGICNFEKELYKFEFFSPWLYCRMTTDAPVVANLDSKSANPVSTGNAFAEPVDESKMLNKLRVSQSNSFKLISTFNDSNYQCDILRVLSKHLTAYAPQCYRLQHTPYSVMTQQIFKTNVISHLSLKNISDQQTDVKFCLASDSEMENFCEYRNEYGDTCSLNLFLNRSSDYTFDQDGYCVMKYHQNESILYECSNYTSKESHIYVCGPMENRIFDKIKISILNVMDYVSVFLLFLYLVISINKQNLRSLPKRIFYSYAISLWALYLCGFILKYVKLCLVKYYVFSYISQSHSFWILITSYDLWRLVYNSLKLKKISVEGQTKRFAVYCFIAWGLPGLLLTAIFPTLKDTQKSWSCPSISGFHNELICSSGCEFNQYTHQFGWITIIIFLILAPCLLMLTSVFVCLSTRNRARSNVNRTYIAALLKVAVMMGIHWMLLVYLTVFTSSEKFNGVYEFISSFHGSFIFFAFGLEKSNLDRLRRFTTISTTKQTQDTSLTQNDQEVKLPIRQNKSFTGNADVEK